MRVACNFNLVSERLSFSLLHDNKESVFTVGLLQLVWTVPVCRIWKFSCPLISDYIDDKKLVNLRASNIIGKLMGVGWGEGVHPTPHMVIQICSHGTCVVFFLTKAEIQKFVVWGGR